MRSLDEFETVKNLAASGMNDCAIARKTGIPRRTVRDLRCRPMIRARLSAAGSMLRNRSRLRLRCRRRLRLSTRDLPGRWLHLTRPPRVATEDHTRLSLPRNHRPHVARPSKSLCRASVRGLGDVPTIARKFICAPNTGRVCSPNTARARSIYDQSGSSRGRKCSSKKPPKSSFAALIDSDGCRVVANDRGVKSIRYHFSNRSDDIRGLFCAALDELGIPWTRPRWFEVAVYRKAAVARLDEFVGPKA